MTQSELQLENELIAQLSTGGFERVSLKDTEQLQRNLKAQLEKFNGTEFSELEFSRILNHLQKGDRFDKAKVLRDRLALKRDDESTSYIRFFNMDNYCKNRYQVTNQITQKGTYENRYDVTLLINGLPLVQIELKRRGMEMKEAFNQITRYHRHSFPGTLFEYVQVFVISNGVNTKYFANNTEQNFEQTFFWTDEQNRKITKLQEFTDVFLEKCFLSEYIAEYIVLAEAKRASMILRPYQYYAATAIEDRVKQSNKNGYIWHTTGSGKTLTSFKTSQLIGNIPEVKKVLFVVDRKDLDTQTIQEFNSFSEGSVDGTDNTSSLVKQLKDPHQKLIVTTIQKLDIAIGRESYLNQIENLRDEKVVIIFDECHRSQFGKTHAAIKGFFQNCQLFGFTGTPIFAENNSGGVTTKDVFDECLHKYIITHAIADNNVLGFAVEYVGKYTSKRSASLELDIETNELSESVPAIDKKEVFEDPKRLEKIADFILGDWKRKTKSGKYNALFAVSSIETLKKYYTILKERKADSFNIATIFTYKANEEFSEEVDVEEGQEINVKHSREFLEDCIEDYNKTYSTNYSTDKFYNYYKDLQKRIKNKEVDLVLVVNMFLTGFDSKRLNTLYVDKNLQYHSLIQAYSRTNRILNSDKPHGNIVAFRNLKANTDKALALYGDEDAQEVVIKQPYEQQAAEFKEKLAKLKTITPTVESVSELQSEQEKVTFVKSFRELLRTKAAMETSAEFSFDDLGISEQEFYDYQSKYLDIYDARKVTTIAASIIEEIDFEIELTIRDVIDFDYIIKLIIGLKNISSDKLREKKSEDILKLFDRDLQLRKKKDLIRKFIEENLPRISSGDNIEKEFSEFWKQERTQKLNQFAENEGITVGNLEYLVSEYLYTQKLPKDQDIVNALPQKPSILERRSIIDKIKLALQNIIEIFEW